MKAIFSNLTKVKLQKPVNASNVCIAVHFLIAYLGLINLDKYFKNVLHCIKSMNKWDVATKN